MVENELNTTEHTSIQSIFIKDNNNNTNNLTELWYWTLY
jgi:hypothetical protein